MGSDELSEWFAFSRMEPLDANRSDYNTGQISMMMFNLWRGEKTKPLDIEEFLIFRDKPSPKVQTKEDHKRPFDILSSVGIGKMQGKE